MSEDPRSDEALIIAHKKGDNNALEILYQRYYNQVHFYLLKESLIKDESFLEDVKHEIFLKALTRIRDGGFTPEGAGSFRAWFYTMAQNICRTMNRRKGREPLNLSQLTLDSIPDKTYLKDEEEPESQSETRQKLIRILRKLSKKEQRLMILLGKGKTYRQIRERDEFKKHSLDYLMLKAYNIRKKILKYKE